MPHGQIGFVDNDVAKVLGYSNYRNAIANHVDADDKLRTQIEYAGQKRDVTFINESGLYALILSSKPSTLLSQFVKNGVVIKLDGETFSHA